MSQGISHFPIAFHSPLSHTSGERKISIRENAGHNSVVDIKHNNEVANCNDQIEQSRDKLEDHLFR
jgi:hypothetical protein